MFQIRHHLIVLQAYSIIEAPIEVACWAQMTGRLGEISVLVQRKKRKNKQDFNEVLGCLLLTNKFRQFNLRVPS